MLIIDVLFWNVKEVVMSVSNTIYDKKKLNIDVPSFEGFDTSVDNSALNKSIARLQEIANLNDDWNGNGAEHFSTVIIDKTKDIVCGLTLQPEIFPTAKDTIQLEYDGKNDSYLEFEVGNTDKASVFSIDSNGRELNFVVDLSADSLNKVISEFYG